MYNVLPVNKPDFNYYKAAIGWWIGVECGIMYIPRTLKPIRR